MKQALICTSIALSSSATWAEGADAVAGPDQGRACWTFQRGEWIELEAAPPLLDLIVHPAHYDGCDVVVGGYLSSGYPTATLYLNRDDKALAGMLFGSIVVSLRDARVDIDLEEMKAADGTFVLVAGKFKDVKGGLGVISGIKRLDLGKR